MPPIPANEDPSHPRPMTRSAEIRLMEGAEERHAGYLRKWMEHPGYVAALFRSRRKWDAAAAQSKGEGE